MLGGGRRIGEERAWLGGDEVIYNPIQPHLTKGLLNYT